MLIFLSWVQGSTGKGAQDVEGPVVPSSAGIVPSLQATLNSPVDIKAPS